MSIDTYEYVVIVTHDDFVSTPTFATRSAAEAFVERVSKWLGGGAATFSIHPVVNVTTIP